MSCTNRKPRCDFGRARRTRFSLVLLAGVGAGSLLNGPFLETALAAEPERAAATEPGGQQDSVTLEHRLNAVAAEIEALKSGNGAVSALDAQVAALVSEVAALRQENLALRNAQKDAAAELGHVRADVANMQIGLESLRTSIDEHEASRRDADAALDSSLARLTQETVSLRASQSNAATELAPMRAELANTEIGLESLRATMAHSHDAAGPAAAVGSAPHRKVRRILADWIVQDGQKGRPVVSGDSNVYPAVPGTVLPGLGRVTELRREDNRWVVVTEKGMIVQR
jgi:hypothetical protein